MKLYYPIWAGESKFIECEITRPTPKIISDTAKIVSDGNYGSGLLYFVASCITQYKDLNGNIVEDKERIKLITRDMKQKCLEDLSTDIMLKLDPNDAIEGIYYCPRCNRDKICECKGDIDTRDYLSLQDVNYYDGDDCFTVPLSEMFIRKEKGIDVEKITSLSFKYPSITDLINNGAKFGYQNSFQVQYGILADCLIKVDNQAITKEYKSKYSLHIIESLPSIKDIRQVTSEMNKYGRDLNIKKTCNSCSKEWVAKLNTSNFFVSALRSE